MTPETGIPSRARAILVTLLAGGFVALLTLQPATIVGPVQPHSFSCLLGCGQEDVRDLLSNILLFIPLGWALCHWMRPRPVLLVCLLATITIEGLQATVIAGRDSSLRDILSNVAGGGAGILLYAHWRAVLVPSASTGRRLAALAAAVWIAVLAITALGNQLDPTFTKWFGFWAPDLAYYQRFAGQLNRVSVDDWTPENGPIADPAPLQAAMQRDSFRLVMDLVTGPKPSGRSLIFAVIDTNERPQVLAGQERRAFWLTFRNRFEAWGFRGTLLRIPILAGSDGAGNRVTIEAGRMHRSLVLRATHEGITQEIGVPQTVGLGWTSMIPFRFAISSEAAVFNPLWLAGLIFPLGWWLGRGSGWSGFMFLAAALVAGLWLVPLFIGAAPSALGEWIGGAIGGALSCGLGARFRPGGA